MKFPLTSQFGYIQILGSINGLVCLNLCRKATFIVLWNPATRRCCRIPYPQLESEMEESVSLGFSYDEKTDCYKIVRILSFAATPISESPWVVRVEIYNTRTNNWRTTDIVDLPRFYSPSSNADVVINGVPYWYAIHIDSTVEPGYFQDLIVWFDASTEAFRFHALQAAGTGEVSCLLQLMDVGYFRHVGLEDMGEQPVLTFMKYNTVRPCGLEQVDLRKLNKFNGGTNSCRIEELSIKPPPNFMHVVGFGRNGEMIAAEHDSALFLYGNESKRLASCSGGYPYVYHYNESLVWPSTLY